MIVSLRIIGVVLVLLTISTSAIFPIAKADTYLGYQAGEFLYECQEPYDYSCQPYNGWGVAANIMIFSPAPPSGEGVGFWVGLDYGVGTPTHYWFQAGYIVGQAPDGNYYSQPILYAEYNNSGYHFQVIATNVAYRVNHFFQVWVCGFCNTPLGYIQVDSNIVVTAPAPSQMANGNSIGGVMEVHQLPSLGSAGNVYTAGVWADLNYAASSPAYCPSLSYSAWYKWRTDPLYPFYNSLGVPTTSSSTNPYGAGSINSTAFQAAIGGAIGGSGCGGCRLS